MASESATLYENVYKGLGSHGTGSTALPPQAIPLHRKGKKWRESCMDRLEEIGRRQVLKNSVFSEYYAMVEGDLAYTDYEETPEILAHVSDLRDRSSLPSYVKHFDLIGRIGRHLQGKYNDTKSKFRVDFFDDIAQNEYDREINNRLFDFSQKYFQLELQTQLIKRGISLDQEFESEEQRQQYLQFIESEKAKLDTPPQIKTAMSTQWKPQAAVWAENTLEKDRARFNSDEREREFFMDKYLTGRYFNHYRIGYDYYKPERWDPCETFFSEDADIKYPQDGEYVGNIQDMAPSKIVDMFGHLMEEKDIKKILNAFDYTGTDSENTGEMPNFEKAIIDGAMGEDTLVPHEDYFDRQSTIALEEATGTPLSEITYFGEDGETKTAPSWTPNYEFDTDGTYKTSKYLRRDIDVRDDTIRVVQAYWRSWERIGLIYYETEMGFGVTEWVTDEILDGFLEENNITKLRKLSLTEFRNRLTQGTLEPNSIVFTYAPRVYKGIKLSGTNTILNKDIYLDVGPMDFQIKGDSNLYDVKLPVSGIISTSEAKKIRPYQIEYNYQMNLMHSLTEKEIGIFWLFDIALLPSDFDGLGDSKEILTNVVDMARDIGMVPIDMSKQNMRDRVGQQFNSMMAQDISFIPQIQAKMQLAEYYKALALESIGVTPQDMGTPSEYSTAEGIKVGQANTLSQIEHIFEAMDEARLKDMELNLAIAQYCQTNNKDISVSYTQSSETQILVREVFQDENFHLRKFGLLPIADSKKRKELETFKQFLLNNNTFSNDVTDFAKVISSDSMEVVTNLLKESYRERLQQTQEERQHQINLQQQQIQADQEKVLRERQYELEKQARELENNIQVATIQHIGRLQDNSNEEDVSKKVEELSDKYLQNDREDRKLEMAQEEKENKNKIALQKLKNEMEALQIKREQNQIKREAIQAKTFGDVINKN